MSDTTVAAVILAAGDGKRMKSDKPKVCCEVLFKPMLSWVTDACQNAGLEKENTCVVVSDKAQAVLPLLPQGICTAVQRERLGTGHAVKCTAQFLLDAKKRGVTDVTVLYGDAPLIDPGILSAALSYHRQNSFEVTCLTAKLSDPARYGRIIREGERFLCIKEAADASADELLLNEVNSGAYWFSIDFLISALSLLKNENIQGEYYLTDTVALSKKAGAFLCSDERIALGANDRKGLALLNRSAHDMVLDKLYDLGVDIPLADTVMIGPDVKIGRDTVILPGTILCGSTKIGCGCTIGPNTRIIDCEVGDNTIIDACRLEKSRVGSSVRLGPFSQLRPDSFIADGVKIGNFVEVKNSVIGEKTSLAHLTYIGDSDFGSRINVGCGVVTVNYNGVSKFRTTVEDDAFIGCNSNLIAPVTVQRGAYVAAATTVTQEVPADSMAIGRVRQEIKPKMALLYRKKK